MHLDKLRLLNFKNYEQLELDLSSKINCFVGNNGTGKTNLLDAIHYLSLTKSYFNNIDSQNIRHEQDFFVIEGEYQRKELPEKIYCGVKKGKRKHFRRNNKEYNRFSDHVGLIPVVMISPADSSLITAGSEVRRKFIDAVISQYDASYLDRLIRYNRALVQRNTLLKEFAKKGTFHPSGLEVWSEQLINLGAQIHEDRKQFTQAIIPLFQKYYSIISTRKETVSLEYQSQLEEGPFDELMSAALEKDRLLQYTTSGTHKDDLIFSLDEWPMKKIGSQGQQKTYLVALKMAKFEYINKLSGFKPIMLLDDVFDKFDAVRVKRIIELVAGDTFGQIFITDTNQDRIGLVLQDLETDYRLFTVEDGKVAPQE